MYFLKITNLEKFIYLLKNKDLFTDLKPGTANQQKLEAHKTCDIIHPVSLVSGADLLLFTTGFGTAKNKVIFVSYLKKSSSCDYGKIAPELVFAYFQLLFVPSKGE